MSQTKERPPQQDQSVIVFDKYTGLNTQASRLGIEDTQMSICDSWCPIGDDNLRTIWDNGPPIFSVTPGTTLVSYNFGNIGSTPWGIMFLSDGSVWKVNTNTATSSRIAPPGTIGTPSQAGITQWGALYIIIVSPSTNNYFVWDGTTFYFPGNAIPGIDGPGPIFSSTLDNGGSGYAVNDTGTVTGGVNDATYIVTSINQPGDGSGYTVGDTGIVLAGSADAAYVVNSVSAGGMNYVTGDTGTILTGTADAHYVVASVGPGGTAASLTLSAPGTNYTAGSNIATATGGGHPGVGTGLLVTITTGTSPAPISSATLNSGGSGYVVNDTGTILSGSANATYIVNTVGALGVVTAATLTNPGTAYNTATNVSTATGGAQPGVGTGLTFDIVVPTLHPVSSVKTGTGSVVSAALTNVGTSYFTADNVATDRGGTQPGSGNGLEFNITAAVSGGPITAFTLTPSGVVTGYTLTFDGTLYLSGTVETAVGGAQPGSGTGLTLNITVTSATMPLGVSGTAAEIYSGHVWVINGAELLFTAPGSFTDFSTSNGGGSAVSNDSFLRVRYVQIVQSNGYLYLFGDSSISYIAGVTTTGTPPTTSYTQQSIDPETGTVWPGTVDVLGSNIVFANAWGAHVSFGGRAAKVSAMLDGIYNTQPNFGGLIPTAAKTIMYGKRVWVLLLPVVDSYTGQPTNKLFIWDEKKWFSAQQSALLTYIQHQEIDSVLTAYGTDGNNLYPLFTTPNINVTKIVQSKFWAVPGGLPFVRAINRFWGIVQYISSVDTDITVSVDSEFGPSEIIIPFQGAVIWTNDTDDVVTWTNNSAAIVMWFPSASSTNANVTVIAPQAVGQNGVLAGLTIKTNAGDLVLMSAAVMPVDVQYRG
jgi:hypothetical protein